MGENTHHLVDGERVELTPEEKFDLDALAEQAKSNLPQMQPTPPTRQQLMQRVQSLEAQLRQLADLVGGQSELDAAQSLIITPGSSSQPRGILSRLASAFGA